MVIRDSLTKMTQIYRKFKNTISLVTSTKLVVCVCVKLEKKIYIHPQVSRLHLSLHTGADSEQTPQFLCLV